MKHRTFCLAKHFNMVIIISTTKGKYTTTIGQLHVIKNVNSIFFIDFFTKYYRCLYLNTLHQLRVLYMNIPTHSSSCKPHTEMVQVVLHVDIYAKPKRLKIIHTLYIKAIQFLSIFLHITQPTHTF